MTDHEIGNIYKGHFQYQDSPNQSDFRRLLLTDIIGDNSEIGIMTQITGEPPKDPPKYFDQFKKPIDGWLRYGLTKMSYARINKNFPIPLNVLSKPIGKMDDEEFLPIAIAILQYIKENGFKH
jgi:mRNA interferase MazF